MYGPYENLFYYSKTSFLMEFRYCLQATDCKRKADFVDTYTNTRSYIFLQIPENTVECHQFEIF